MTTHSTSSAEATLRLPQYGSPRQDSTNRTCLQVSERNKLGGNGMSSGALLSARRCWLRDAALSFIHPESSGGATNDGPTSGSSSSTAIPAAGPGDTRNWLPLSAKSASSPHSPRNKEPRSLSTPHSRVLPRHAGRGGLPIQRKPGHVAPAPCPASLVTTLSSPSRSLSTSPSLHRDVTVVVPLSNFLFVCPLLVA